MAETEKKHELTISAQKANNVALLLGIPVVILGMIFALVWDIDKQVFQNFFFNSAFWLIPAIIVGIVVHELIHGLTWALFTSRGFRSVRFGIIWKVLSPYCYSKESLKAWQYKTGAIMPAIILGFIPLIIAFLTGNISLLVFGLLFTLAAGGDFLILWLLRKVPKDALVEDHPSKPGCYVHDQ